MWSLIFLSHGIIKLKWATFTSGRHHCRNGFGFNGRRIAIPERLVQRSHLYGEAEHEHGQYDEEASSIDHQITWSLI